MKRVLFAMLAIAAVVPAWAQEDGDAPDHGVARISVLNGEVSLRHGDSADLTAAALNAPVLAGDRVLTDAGSRAEVQFDNSHMIRLAPFTEVRIGDLQYRKYDLQLAAGTAIYRVLRDSDAQVEIGTPVISMRPRTRGSYRMTLRPDGSVEVTVRSGEADVFSPTGSEIVRTGQTMLARGTAADTEFQIVAATRDDEFDRWSVERDRGLESSVSSRYVSPDIYGAEELDGNGDWVYDQPYGMVWAPRVAAGWAPYRVGRWGWTDYYGWSWISGDPWGWAPYHYGRWYQGSRGWLWYPGAIGPRYYWRPALVGFFGWGGGGFGGFGFGNVGWCPLAPYEVYRPWYGRGFGGRGFSNVIVSNSNIGGLYRNAGVNGFNGVTSVRSGDFGRGAINNGNFVRANEGDLRGAGDIRGQVPIGAGAESRRFADRAVNAQSFPQSNQNATFFRSNQGSTGAVGTQAGGGVSGRSNAPSRTAPAGNANVGGGAVAGSGAGPSAGPGWRRLDGGGTRGAAPQNPAASAGGNSGGGNASGGNGQTGWRRLDGGSPNTPSNGGPTAFGTRGNGAAGVTGNGTPNNGVVNNNGNNTGGNGNWRRLDGAGGGAPTGGAPQAGNSYPRGQPNYGGFGGGPGASSAPAPSPQRQFGGGSNPVQINPPIVRSRPSYSGGNSSYGGFGQARPSGGGGGGGSAPAPARGNGGGGGGGNRGGGGGGHRGR